MVRHFTAWNHEEAKGPLSQTTPSPHRFRHSLCLPLQPRAVDIPTVLCSTLHQHFSTVGQIVSSFASEQTTACCGVDTVTSLHWTGNRASPLPENRFSVSRQKKKHQPTKKTPTIVVLFSAILFISPSITTHLLDTVCFLARATTLSPELMMLEDLHFHRLLFDSLCWAAGDCTMLAYAMTSPVPGIIA